ncbi:MAG: LLM class F420-dependent oxidoreductase [Chloroflexi bacterium]|nr:LLM class F420-dependent oxidoreductase [Chloroflexota bacterium]
MKYGFALSGRGPSAEPDALSTIARKGDELGFEWLLTGDHIVVPDSIDSTYPYTEGGEFPGSASGMAMEQLAVLSFLAGQTRRIRLVTSVMIVPHRNPLVAAKALATLDVLSKGRLVVGIGAGWMREEFEALGLPPFEERGAVTDEYIRAFQELWSSDTPTFDGKYLSFSDITFLPKPVQKPHLPIWVGGESRAAIRRAGQVGDAWYPIGSNPQFPMGDPEALAAGIRRLAAQTERAGRDPSEVETVFRTHDYRLEAAGISHDRPYFAGSVEQIAADIRTYEELGVSGLVFDLGRISRDVDDVLRHLEDLATRVMPAV